MSEERKFITHRGKEYEYGKPLTVGEFQQLSGILGKTAECFVGQEELTAGQFAGKLGEKGHLIDFICTLLKCDVSVGDELEYQLVMEVVNDFFFTNGFWLMASGFIEMPSEISAALEAQTTTPKTERANLGKKMLGGNSQKQSTPPKKKIEKSSTQSG